MRANVAAPRADDDFIFADLFAVPSGGGWSDETCVMQLCTQAIGNRPRCVKLHDLRVGMNQNGIIEPVNNIMRFFSFFR